MAGLFGFWTWRYGVTAVRIVMLQHRAESFPIVQGKILSGEARTVHGYKGSIHYHPSFSYQYQVAGKSYTGRRYRYDALPSFWDIAAAEQVVQAHPIGSEIDVHYNPADPRQAILSTPVKGIDFGLLLVAFPIWLVWLYGMIVSVRQIISVASATRVAGGVKVISQGVTIRVRLPQRDPLSWCVCTMFFLSLASGMVINMNPDIRLQAVEMMMLFVALAGAAIYFWLFGRICSGSQDLIIDDAGRTLQLPLNYKRRERMQCAFSDVKSVWLEKVAHRGRYGVTYTYAPTLAIAGKASQRLADFKKEQAEAFVAWLREKIGVAPNN